VCEDVIIRLCLATTCPGVNEALAPGEECQASLLERTGCGADEFTFSEPSRERVLHCRLPLVRRGTSPTNAPTCQEVAEVQRECPDVVRFISGGVGQP
jgi:hypothetical protein